MSQKPLLILVCGVLVILGLSYYASRLSPPMKERPGPFDSYAIGYETPVDAELQRRLEDIDTRIREPLGMSPDHAAAGVLDLRTMRLAMVHPDRIDYAASVAKIGILLAYFQLRPASTRNLDPQVRHELGLMAKASSNEMAAKYSRELGLREIQQVLDTYGFYDANRGGGLWVGRHYGQNSERIGDPVGDHSHAATVRQLLRFYLLLEQGKLVSPAASQSMQSIFESPEIPHDRIKFVKALEDRTEVRLIRKWGSWQDWLHDTAVISGPSRHYILVGMTHHPRGDDYLVGLARSVDDLLAQYGVAPKRRTGGTQGY